MKNFRFFYTGFTKISTEISAESPLYWEVLSYRLGENKDIVEVVESSFWVNFDQTMMEIYFDSSVSGVIPIAFE
jgi:hypothetical protein